MSRREREYTPEEAFALTMRDATPHWYGSTPLVVGMTQTDRPYPQPLDPVLNSGSWVFFFVSATGAEFFHAFLTFKAWFKRYQPLGIQFVFSFRGHYAYFKERRVVEAWVKSFGYSIPFVCDPNGNLSKSFGATGEPAIAILNNGEIIFSNSGPSWNENAEERLQKLLRESAPGLSLWPVLKKLENQQQTTDRWPLYVGSKALLNKSVSLIGKWEFDENRITTIDSAAEIYITAPASGTLLVARSLSDSGDPTRIRFDTEGASFPERFSGGDMVVDDEGNSSLILKGPRAYSALTNLPPELRRIRFRFPFAKVSKVAIYGFEFSENSSRP